MTGLTAKRPVPGQAVVPEQPASQPAGRGACRSAGKMRSHRGFAHRTWRTAAILEHRLLREPDWAGSCQGECLRVAAWAWQDEVAFAARNVDEPLPTPLPFGGEQVFVDVEGVGRVEGWFLPGVGAAADTPAPAVLFVHGNAETIVDWPWLLDDYYPWGVSLLVILVVVLGMVLHIAGPRIREAFIGTSERTPWVLRPVLWFAVGMLLLALKPAGNAPYIYFGF